MILNMFVIILLNSGWVLDDLLLQKETHCYLKSVEIQNISIFFLWTLLSTQETIFMVMKKWVIILL